MSDAAIASIVTGLVTIVTLIASVVALWIKAQSAAGNALEAKGAASEAKAAAKVAADTGERTAEVVDVIHKATNSDRDRADAREAALKDQLEALRAKIDSLYREALDRAKSEGGEKK